MEHSMQLVYKNLQTNELIGSTFIKQLREYINRKYPGRNSAETSKIFADAVNRAIDKHISHFNEEHRRDIRKSLINNSMNKGRLAITAADVFEISILSGIKSDDFLEGITRWVNGMQDVQLSTDSLFEVISGIEQNRHKKMSFEDMLVSVNGWQEAKPISVRNQINKGKIIENIHINTALKNVKTFLNEHRLLAAIMIAIIFLSSLNILIYIGRNASEAVGISLQQGTNKSTSIEDVDVYMKISPVDKRYIETNKLGSEFRYCEVNTDGVRQFLKERQSLLAADPYFSVIMNMGKKYDVNPLLLLAITGQEQSFVPNYQKEAKKIANNPFNVYGSWQIYNTNIVEACEIAARTIIDLSKDKPAGFDTIKWINKRYAEDPSWYIGVSKFFSQLRNSFQL